MDLQVPPTSANLKKYELASSAEPILLGFVTKWNQKNTLAIRGNAEGDAVEL